MNMKIKIVAVLFCSIITTTAAAIGLHSFSPTGGIIYPGGSWKPGFQVGALVNFLKINEDISISALANYWESENRKEALEGVVLSNLKLGMDLRYRFKKEGFYTGLGLSLNNLQKDFQNSSVPSIGNEDPENEIGFSILGGYNFVFDGFDALLAELKYSRVAQYNVIGLKLGLYFYITG